MHGPLGHEGEKGRVRTTFANPKGFEPTINAASARYRSAVQGEPPDLSSDCVRAVQYGLLSMLLGPIRYFVG
jgi:hypothetical protein